MKATVSEAMTSWNEFLAWCTREGKEPKHYSSMQDYLNQKSQVNPSC